VRPRPLDPLSSIKVKLGVVILAAVAVTAGVEYAGLVTGFHPWFFTLVAAALALGVVQLLAHGMTFPLREMAAAAREMARGDYARRVTASSRDEVGELARAFNAMAAELAEVDRLRRDLVANVSHELRRVRPLRLLPSARGLGDQPRRAAGAARRDRVRQPGAAGRVHGPRRAGGDASPC